MVFGGINAWSRDYWVYVGPYTRAESKGIYVGRFNPESGQISPWELAAETPSPSFLAVDPQHRFLYAVNEVRTFQDQPGGGVSAFAMDAGTGKLAPLNTVSSKGSGPCHLSVDAKGKWVLAANYGSGSIASFPIGPDGKLGQAASFVQHEGTSVNPERQKGPHAHWIDFFPGGRFALTMDLGLDKLLVYRFDEAGGALTPNQPPSIAAKPGSGPRHFAFHPKGKFGYSIHEMGNILVAYSVDAAAGTLKEIQTLTTLPDGFQGKSFTAEIFVHPSGKFVYGSNRGHDSICSFAVDPKQGTLSPIETVSTEGQFPRSFAIDPTGNFMLVANQNSNNMILFRIDPKTGRLRSLGAVAPLQAPVCVLFVPVK